ncbi:MAG: hypothetical protein JNL04_03615 [Rhodospirillaceae bacterium]|nr:hypothetical protein [Rhodospirillaceae bacterium]
MLLPVSQPTEPGGSAGISSRHLAELIVTAVPPGTTGLPDHRLHKRQEAAEVDRVVTIGPSVGPGAAEPDQALSHRMARWEPVARALGHATQAIAGFLKSVGVPQAQAEDMARRAAEAARERLAIDRQATQAQFESGRLSVKLEDVHVGFPRGSGKGDVSIGKAEIAIDVDIPGARHEESGASIGNAEAEIGLRTVGFAYQGPGATPAYADRGAASVTFTVAAPLLPSAPSTSVPSGPVDVAI